MYMHYITGQDRNQTEFLSCLDDLVSKQHYTRLIDLLSDLLVNENMSLFSEKGQYAVGRRAYHPAILLKIYLYGYLNGISSSRKLEKECYRNTEMIWLLGRLTPDHKTIADFRRCYTEGIRFAIFKFNNLLKESGYIKGKILSVDGSKIRANAGLSIDLDTVSKRLEHIEKALNEYLCSLEKLDNEENELEQAGLEKIRLQEEVDQLKQQLEELEKQKDKLQKNNLKLLSPTDTDARIMKSRNGKHFSYNLQTAIDAENHMIAHAKVISEENDKGQLEPMIEAVEKSLNILPEEVLADTGYYVTTEIERIEKEKKINCYIPVHMNQHQYARQANNISFSYNKEEDYYTCSQGQKLFSKYGIKRNAKRGTEAQLYQAENCSECSVKEFCTTSSNNKLIYRYLNQDWRDKYLAKMKSDIGKQKMKQRKSLSEHPFGTLKYWMGQIPLLVRGKRKVQAEIDIYVMAYNFKRLINISNFEEIESLLRKYKWKMI